MHADDSNKSEIKQIGGEKMSQKNKWDMQWKRPRKQKKDWKIPKGIWVIVGLLILFTGITIATNMTSPNQSQSKAPVKKTPEKKETKTTTVTQKQTYTPSVRPRMDRPANKQEQQPTANQNPKEKSQSTTPPANTPPVADATEDEPGVKTIYVYKDHPSSNPNKNTKPTSPKPSSKKPAATKPAPKTKPKPKKVVISKKNVIKNNGFEHGLDYWDSWSPEGQGVVHAIAKDYPASGKADLVHWANRDYRQLTYQNIYDIPDGIYVLKGMVRSSKGQADLKLGVKDFDNTRNNEENYVQLNSNSDPNKWKSFQVPNVVVKGGSAIVFLYSVAKKGQWADFDNLNFYRVK
jgi:hypothetical protein